ncbi:MAG: hypothetical protein QM680_10850 [Luteolibacter sp.]
MTSARKSHDEDNNPRKKRASEPKSPLPASKEMDLWDLGDEESPAEPALRKTAAPRKKRASKTAKKSAEAPAETGQPPLDLPAEKPAPEPTSEAENSHSEPETTTILETVALSPEVVEEESTVAFSEPLPAAKPREKFSKLEKTGLISLLVLLIGALTFVVGFSISRLPSEQKLIGDDQFPVRGKTLTIQNAETFWRAPVTTGNHPDRVRLGTELIPVLTLKVQTQGSSLRVLFRDADGNIAGDGISRSISSSGTVEIAASVGFTDRGMHAAYRAGEGKPWKVEVYEGPSANAESGEFKKIFETHISPSLH